MLEPPSATGDISLTLGMRYCEGAQGDVEWGGQHPREGTVSLGSDWPPSQGQVVPLQSRLCHRPP